MTTLMSVQHWTPPDKLKIRRTPGWAPRWIRKAEVEHRIVEGWRVVNRPVRKDGESGPVDQAIHYRGLILMEIPQHMADERNAYYRGLHQRKLRAVARGAMMKSVRDASTHEGRETEDGKSLAGTIGKGLQARTEVETNDGLVHSNEVRVPVEAHPDDLREDEALLDKMKSEQAESEESSAEKEPAARSKRKNRR